MIAFDTKQKLHKNVRDLGKLFVAKGFKNVPKVQKIAQSGHTGRGGGQVVSVLAFYSDDPSSNPADAYTFFCKVCI